MDNLKELSCTEIIERKDKYIARLNDLMRKIEMYLEGNRDEPEYKIRHEYAALKKEIKEEAIYLKKIGTIVFSVSQDHNGYLVGITEASAYGFNERANVKISFKTFTSVAEARYKLNKCFE